jgi:hypothetical protein
MTKQEQLTALVCISEILDGYVSDLAYCGVIPEKEEEGFDKIIEKIDKVAEAIRHETTPPTYVYAVWEDWHGTIGYHKTFEGAKKQLMEDSGYKELADNCPLDYNDETCWGWEVLYIERIELGE